MAALRLSAVLALLGPALAQAAIPEDAQPIPVGDADAYVHLRVDYERSDNRFLVPDDPESTSGFVVRPSLALEADRRTLAIEMSYDGGYGVYDDEELDYTDHLARVAAAAGFTKRVRGDARLVYRRDHDSFGTELARGGARRTNELLVSDTTLLELSGRYGVDDARLNVSGGLLTSARRSRREDSSLPSSDSTLLQPYVGLSWRVSPDTRGTLELRHGIYDYDNRASDRDVTSLFGGLNFAATGKLRGFLRVGVAQENFDEPTVSDESRFLVNTSLDYRASTISAWKLALLRTIDNQEGATAEFVDGGVVSSTATLDWRYRWSGRLSHRAYVGASLTERACPSLDSNKTFAGLELDFSVRRWLAFGVGVDGDARTGEDCPGAEIRGAELDYDRVRVSAHVSVTL